MKESHDKQIQAIRDDIESACTVKVNILTRAMELLHEMELEHQRGQQWVHLDSANAWAVHALVKLEMITRIEIDGTHRGQIAGAFD
jgi:hypothetical protein